MTFPFASSYKGETDTGLHYLSLRANEVSVAIPLIFSHETMVTASAHTTALKAFSKAVTVAAMSSSLWASDTNAVSNCDGGQ